MGETTGEGSSDDLSGGIGEGYPLGELFGSSSGDEGGSSGDMTGGGGIFVLNM